MSGSRDEGDLSKAEVGFPSMLDALGERWASMEDGERVFLVYCLLRLRYHRAASVRLRIMAGAGGRNGASATENASDWEGRFAQRTRNRAHSLPIS